MCVCGPRADLLSIQRIGGTNRAHQLLIKNGTKSPNNVLKPDNELNSTSSFNATSDTKNLDVSMDCIYICFVMTNLLISPLCCHGGLDSPVILCH